MMFTKECWGPTSHLQERLLDSRTLQTLLKQMQSSRISWPPSPCRWVWVSDHTARTRLTAGSTSIAQAWKEFWDCERGGRRAHQCRCSLHRWAAVSVSEGALLHLKSTSLMSLPQLYHLYEGSRKPFPSFQSSSSVFPVWEIIGD